MANYITNADVEKFLNITLQTQGANIVTAIIPAVQALIDNYCNRTWSKGANDEITETFDGGEISYFIKTPPIASIVSVKDSGNTLVKDSDYWVYDSYIKFAVRTVPYPQSIEVKYKTSATTAPEDVKHAMVQWVSQIFKSQSDAGKVVSRVSAGTVSYDYLTKADIPDFVRMVLNNYRVFNAN